MLCLLCLLSVPLWLLEVMARSFLIVSIKQSSLHVNGTFDEKMRKPCFDPFRTLKPKVFQGHTEIAVQDVSFQ